MDPLFKEIIIVLISIFLGLSLFAFLATRHFITHQRRGIEDGNNDDAMCIVFDRDLLSTTSKEPSEWRFLVDKIEAIEDRLALLENQKTKRKVWGLALSILFPLIAVGAPFLYIFFMISQKLPQ